jgi:hypothetical protein
MRSPLGSVGAMPAPVADRVTDRAADRRALRGLRAGRRAERLRHLDWVDALYRAYMIGIVTISVLMALAYAVSDTRLTVSTIGTWRADGPALVGIVAAIAAAMGLRSGSHGGPLVFEAADVQHVLLAPVDRGIVVRSTAFRQLRGVVAVGALAGAVLGLTVSDRMPPRVTHAAAPWLLAGAAAAVLIALLAWSAALLASGLRFSRVTASLLGLALVGWSVADVAAGTSTSPLTRLGAVALAPIAPVDVVGVLLVLAVLVVALVRAGSVSLEPALQRARLVQSLRFAATFQDLRAVIVLRHQLAHETPRVRPWFRLRPRATTGRATWRRDWHGALRWPVSRVARIATLAVVTGMAAAAAWKGTTPFVAVCAMATYAIALDVTEGFAQETDHPDIGLGLPEPLGPLMFRHLAAPVAILAGTGLLGVAAAVVTTAVVGGHTPAGGVAVTVIVVLAALAAMPAAAALSIYLGRPDRDLAVVMLHPGVSYALQAAPVVMTALAFVPIIAATAVEPPASPAGVAFAVAWPGIAVAGGVLAFLRTRVWQAR